MKKIRKLMSALLAMSLVFSLLAVSASAAGAEETGMQPFNLQALADQDLETASPEMKEAIMLARRLLASGSAEKCHHAGPAAHRIRVPGLDGGRRGFRV